MRNTARRTLELDVAVTGAPGLMAKVSPAVLAPGETAEVFISGTVAQPGALRGQIIITALDGFVRRQVSLTGEVKAPAAAAPAPAISIPTPAEPLPTSIITIPVPAGPIRRPVVRPTPLPIRTQPATQ